MAVSSANVEGDDSASVAAVAYAVNFMLLVSYKNNSAAAADCNNMIEQHLDESSKEGKRDGPLHCQMLDVAIVPNCTSFLR